MSLISTVQKVRRVERESHFVEGFEYTDGDASAPRTMSPIKTQQRYTHYTEYTEYPLPPVKDNNDVEERDHKLSKSAIHNTQRKYGHYDSPATRYNVGLDNVPLAIGKAAQMAERNTSQIDAYHRDGISDEAMKAAQNLGGYALMMIDREKKQKWKSENEQLTKQQDQNILYSVNSAKSVLNDTDNIINLTREYDLKFRPVKKQMNLSKLLTGAEQKANKRITTRYKPENVELNEKRYHDALNAAIAIRHQDYLPNQVVAENKHQLELNAQKWELYKQMTSPKVWQLAQQNANAKLQNQIEFNPETIIYGNMEYNRKAVQIAKERFDKRNTVEATVKEKTSGKINIGGGKWLNIRDVDDIARNLVKPIINEVEATATLERKNDKEIKERRRKYISDAKLWKNDQINKKINDQELIDYETKRQKDELANLDIEFNKAMQIMDTEMQEKIDFANAELHALRKKRHAIKKRNNIEISKLSNLRQEEFDNWEIENKKEIEKLNAEQEDIIKSYYVQKDKYIKREEKLNHKIAANDKDLKDTTNSIKIHNQNLTSLQSKLNEISTSTHHQHEIAKREQLLNNKNIEETQLAENQKQLVFFKLHNDSLLEKLKINKENIRLITNKIKILENIKDMNTNEKILHDRESHAHGNVTTAPVSSSYINSNDIIQQNKIAKEDDIKMLDVDDHSMERHSKDEQIYSNDDEFDDSEYIVETAERATKGKPKIYQKNTTSDNDDKDLAYSRDKVMEDISEEEREDVTDKTPHNTREGSREETRDASVPSFTGFSDNSELNKKDSLFREVF